MNRNHTSASQQSGAGFFLILTLFFLGISVWQTSQGYELILGYYLAWFFSLAIGLMMLYLAFEMRKRRLKGQSANGPLIGYIACAIFCFFGNFNAIYSRYNREELYKKELQQHKQDLTAISTAAIVALEKADTISVNLKKNVLEHEGQLRVQILDPKNLGLGTRALEEVSILEKLLGQKLTKLSGNPGDLVIGYTNNIDQILATKLADSKFSESKSLIAKIIKTRDTTFTLIEDALKPQNVLSKGQVAIYKTVDVINGIGEQIQNFVGKPNFPFISVEFENQELGKISYTFQSAFNGNNTAAAIISLILAIGIDALVPFVIFVGTRREDEEDYSEGKGSDTGGVVILR